MHPPSDSLLIRKKGKYEENLLGVADRGATQRHCRHIETAERLHRAGPFVKYLVPANIEWWLKENRPEWASSLKESRCS